MIMTPAEFRDAYEAFGWKQPEVARRLGYTGSRAAQTISNIANSTDDAVPARVSLLMRFYKITDPALWPALED